MKRKTEEFLYFLLWTAEQLMRPTFRNLNESYEAWAYRSGLLRQIGTLEGQQLVERDLSAPDERIYRLTWQGRLRALGGRDPQKQWGREWDGRWRLVLFDVPTTRNSERVRLRRYLRARHFGYVQNSAWISPDPLEKERSLLRGASIDVESLLLLEAKPCAGESDAEIVAGAWDFERINACYDRCLKILSQLPMKALDSKTEARSLLNWATAERQAWNAAMINDPLLPEKLLPTGYLGRKVWQRRVEVLRKAGKQLNTFSS